MTGPGRPLVIVRCTDQGEHPPRLLAELADYRDAAEAERAAAYARTLANRVAADLADGVGTADPAAGTRFPPAGFLEGPLRPARQHPPGDRPVPRQFPRSGYRRHRNPAGEAVHVFDCATCGRHVQLREATLAEVVDVLRAAAPDMPLDVSYEDRWPR